MLGGLRVECWGDMRVRVEGQSHGRVTEHVLDHLRVHAASKQQLIAESLSDSYSGGWRRGRDLNPREPCGPNGFQDRRHKPNSATPPEGKSELSRSDQFYPAHVRLQRLGHGDHPVRPLIRLDDRVDRPRQRQA